MSNVFIQPYDKNDFDTFLDFAGRENYNLEIATFASVEILDTNWEVILKDYQKKLKGFRGKVSVHGAFLDLLIHSRDKKISAVAKERIRHSLTIAAALNAEYIVLHGNFNPMIKHEKYRQNWLDKNAEFWNEILGEFEITVLIENLWEPSPDMFRRLLDKIKHPNLKICFDTGHANVFSEVSLEEWFSDLRDKIPYIHVNDNNGDADSELVPGNGNINWPDFSRLINRLDMRPNIVFEVGSLANTKKALIYFKNNKIYPFDKN